MENIQDRIKKLMEEAAKNRGASTDTVQVRVVSSQTIKGKTDSGN